MFFSKKTTSALPEASETKLHLSRSTSPVDSFMSIETPLVPSPAYQSGVFERWPRSSPIPSVMSLPPLVALLPSGLATQNSSLQDRYDELKEVSDLNRSTLQQLVEELANKDQECAELRESVCMLTVEQEQAAGIIKGKDEQVSALLVEVDSLKVSHDNLAYEHDQTFRDLIIAKEQVASLQRECNVLASMFAAAEAKVSKYNTHISTFEQQYQASVQEQAKHKQQVDAMHAQKSDAEQRFQAQLQDKDQVIKTLQAQVKQSQLTAFKATVAREYEIAQLKDQLRRATLDQHDQSRQTAEWPELANQQRIRANAMEAEIVELKARAAAV
jgi:chromosome segregation ATPase